MCPNRNQVKGLFAIALVVMLVALPVVTSAAPQEAVDIGFADDGETPTLPGTLKVAVPGVVSIMLAPGSSGEGAITLGPTQIDLPVANASATVDGLTFGQTGWGWEKITIAQTQPTATYPMSIADARITVAGPAEGYAIDASMHIALNPGQAVQGGATLSMAYDPVVPSMDLAMTDASLMIDTAALGVSVTGANTSMEGLAVDQVDLVLPGLGTSLTMTGFTVGMEGTSWESLTVSPQDVQIGTLATISDIQMNVYGPNVGYQPSGSAYVEVHVGPAVYVGGQMKAGFDPDSGEFVTSFCDGSARFAIQLVTIELSGICYTQSSVQIGQVSANSPYMAVEGSMSGITVGAEGALTFDQATITYLPEDVSGGLSGFVVTVEPTDRGLLISSQALVGP